MFDIDKIRGLLKTQPYTAYFWSGLSVNGATIATDYTSLSDIERKITLTVEISIIFIVLA